MVNALAQMAYLDWHGWTALSLVRLDSKNVYIVINIAKDVGNVYTWMESSSLPKCFYGLTSLEESLT